MREMNQEEAILVGAAQSQYLEITEKLVVKGVPEYCVTNYYRANQDNLSTLTAEAVMDGIYQECPNELSYQFDIFPVAVVLI